MTPEGIVKEHVCQWLRLHRISFWVTPSVGIFDAKRGRFRKSKWSTPGVSDLWGFLPDNRPFWIELKSDVGRLSAPQAAFRDSVISRGHLYAVVRSVEILERTFQEWGVQFPIGK